MFNHSLSFFIVFLLIFLLTPTLFSLPSRLEGVKGRIHHAQELNRYSKIMEIITPLFLEEFPQMKDNEKELSGILPHLLLDLSPWDNEKYMHNL